MDKNSTIISQNVLSYIGKASAGYDQIKRSLTTRIARLTSQYRIRKVKEKDNSIVSELIRNVLLEQGGIGIESLYYDRELNGIFEYYDTPNNSFYVVTFQKEVVGTMGIVKSRHGDPNKQNCELRKFYLKKEHRGRGYGKEMLRSLLNEAYYIGYDVCIVKVPNTNTAAIRFFQKEGFMEMSEDLIHKGEHEIVLSKSIYIQKEIV